MYENYKHLKFSHIFKRGYINNKNNFGVILTGFDLFIDVGISKISDFYNNCFYSEEILNIALSFDQNCFIESHF